MIRRARLLIVILLLAVASRGRMQVVQEPRGFNLSEYTEPAQYPVDVYFDAGSAEIGSAQRAALMQDVALTRKSYVFDIELEGHADDPGDAEANERLAKARVEIVERFLRENGVQKSIKTNSFGRSRPAVSGDTEYARAQNRRVHVRMLRGELTASTGSTHPSLHWIEDPPFTVVRVYFATDRKWDGRQFQPLFSNQLSYGWSTVSVPKDHRSGEWERPGWMSFTSDSDQSKVVVLLRFEPMKESEFLGEVKQHVGAAAGRKPDRPDLLIFIHGYRVSFEDALQRAAILAYDLEPAGPTVVYSWPSKGALAGYTADEENNDDTVPHLQAFIKQMASQSGAKRIAIIAHSMGNRALLKALAALQGDASHPPAFSNIADVVLTAPDVSRNKFAQVIEPVTRLAAEVTLYASSRDRALEASRGVHGSALRVGEVDGNGKHIVTGPGFTSVDVTAVSTDFLGHSYFADNRSVLSDLHELLLYSTPPGRRLCLSPRPQKAPAWWVFDRCAAN